MAMLKSYSRYFFFFFFLMVEKGAGEMSGNRVREMNFRDEHWRRSRESSFTRRVNFVFDVSSYKNSVKLKNHSGRAVTFVHSLVKVKQFSEARVLF